MAPKICKELTIFIPCRERYTSLNRCVLSIISQSLKPTTIIICNDNPVSKTSKLYNNFLFKEAIRVAEFYGIKIITIDTFGIGTTKAKNQAIDIIQTKYALYVESDAFLPYDYIEKLYNVLSKNNLIGAVAGCQIVFFDFPDFTDFDLNPRDSERKGEQKIRIIDGRVDLGIKHQVFNYQEENPPPMEVDYFLHTYMFQTKIAKFIGGFDEWFGNVTKSLMFEEVDFTYRIKKEGYKLLLLTNVQMWHLRDKSARRFKYSDHTERNKARRKNELYFIKKHFKNG